MTLQGLIMFSSLKKNLFKDLHPKKLKIESTGEQELQRSCWLSVGPMAASKTRLQDKASGDEDSMTFCKACQVLLQADNLKNYL